MISHLHIENIAVVESADIFFSQGFNVLTGETGAGKSIVISAVNLAFGGRMSKDMIRDGCKGLVVGMVISDIGGKAKELIESLGYLAEDNTVLLYRELTKSGKNICKINSRPATVSILKQIGEVLIDVYSQHEGYRLLSNESHIKYLDIFGNIDEDLQEYRKFYVHMTDIKKQIDDLNLDECEMQRKIHLLEYEIDEIENARVSEGEIERLNDVKKKFNHRQKILSLINETKNLLDGDDMTPGALSGMQRASELLSEASDYVKELKSVSERLRSLFYETSECLAEVMPFINEVDYDPQELEDAEERLDILYKLSRKYGKTEGDILNFLKKAKSELYELKNYKSKTEELEKCYNETMQKVHNIGDKISKRRLKAGEDFAQRVQSELKFLDMPNALFKVHQESKEPGFDGCDKIYFLISANKGEPLRPITSAASGGELSRIMLAIKNVVSEEACGTIIFDEVDTGVSGNAANKIGFKLKQLSQKKQIICITHLAQIAYLADKHFLIEKKSDSGRTYSHINELDVSGRKYELARIIGGMNISDTTLKTAEEMLNLNKNI